MLFGRYLLLKNKAIIAIKKPRPKRSGLGEVLLDAFLAGSGEASLRRGGFQMVTSSDWYQSLFFAHSLVVNSDAYTAEEVGSFDEACRLLDETGFPEHLVVNRSKESIKSFFDIVWK